MDYLIIPLTKDRFAIVDAEDYERLVQYNWYSARRKYTYYACRKLPGTRRYSKASYMHREILGLAFGDKRVVDHINGKGFDNRKSNLRLCLPFQNTVHRIHLDRTGLTSRYRGVYWDKTRRKWAARISWQNRTVGLGRFASEIDAASAYNKASSEFFGEFGYQNVFD